MRLYELFEEAAAGTTSVSSIGQVEFQAFPNRINLIKRCKAGKPNCIAKIKRKTGKGWTLVPTPQWKAMGLDHFGNVQNIKTPVSGMKAISTNLKSMLTRWGVSTDIIKQFKNDE